MEGKLGSGITERQSQVGNELLIMEKINEILSSQIDALSNRLVGVLRSPDPPPDKEKMTEELIVPVAETIREHRYFIEKCSNRISDIIDRLEV